MHRQSDLSGPSLCWYTNRFTTKKTSWTGCRLLNQRNGRFWTQSRIQIPPTGPLRPMRVVRIGGVHELAGVCVEIVFTGAGGEDSFPWDFLRLLLPARRLSRSSLRLGPHSWPLNPTPCLTADRGCGGDGGVGTVGGGGVPRDFLRLLHPARWLFRSSLRCWSSGTMNRLLLNGPRWQGRHCWLGQP